MTISLLVFFFLLWLWLWLSSLRENAVIEYTVATSLSSTFSNVNVEYVLKQDGTFCNLDSSNVTLIRLLILILLIHVVLPTNSVKKKTKIGNNMLNDTVAFFISISIFISLYIFYKNT